MVSNLFLFAGEWGEMVLLMLQAAISRLRLPDSELPLAAVGRSLGDELSSACLNIRKTKRNNDL